MCYTIKKSVLDQHNFRILYKFLITKELYVLENMDLRILKNICTDSKGKCQVKLRFLLGVKDLISYSSRKLSIKIRKFCCQNSKIFNSIEIKINPIALMKIAIYQTISTVIRKSFLNTTL